MRKLTILVDIDNVLEDLNTAWVNAINEKYGTTVSPNDIVDWDITKFFEELTNEQVFSPLRDKELWDSLIPMEHSQEILQKFKDEGHTIYLVTSSYPDTIMFRLEFLKKYFPFIPFSDVIITSQKQLIIGDVLIDDCVRNLQLGTYRGILMNAPHNSRVTEEELRWITRVSNWEQIDNEIQRIANKRWC